MAPSSFLHHLGRAGFEVAFLAFVLVAGVGMFFAGVKPASVAASMPEPLQVYWQAGLVLTGVLGMAGLLLQVRSRPAAGLLIEGAGLSLGASLLLVYGIALVAVNGGKGFVAACFVLAFAVGSILRLLVVFTEARPYYGAPRTWGDHDG